MASDSSRVLPDVGGCTSSARIAMSFAYEETLRFNHYDLGSEHLVLGLWRLGDAPCLANAMIRSLGSNSRTVRLEIEKRIVSLPDMRGSFHVDLADEIMIIWKSAVNYSHRIGEVPSSVEGFGTAGLLIAAASTPDTVAREALVEGCGIEVSGLLPLAEQLIEVSGDEAQFFDKRPRKGDTLQEFVRRQLSCKFSVSEIVRNVPGQEETILRAVDRLARNCDFSDGEELRRRHDLYCRLQKVLRRAKRRQDFSAVNKVRDKIDSLGLYLLTKNFFCDVDRIESEFWKAMIQESVLRTGEADIGWQNAVKRWRSDKAIDLTSVEAEVDAMFDGIEQQMTSLREYIARLPADFAFRFEQYRRWQNVRKDRYYELTNELLATTKPSVSQDKEVESRLVRSVQRTQCDEAREAEAFLVLRKSEELSSYWKFANDLIVPSVKA